MKNEKYLLLLPIISQHMKKYFLLLLLCSFGTSFSQKFTLSGSVSSPYEGKLYLWYNNQVDSTLVSHKEFTFSGNIPYPMKASLSTSKTFKDTGFFILEEGDLRVDIAIENRRQVYFKSIQGSQTLDLVKNFMLFKSKNQRTTNSSELLSLRLEELIRKSPKSQFNGILLSDLLMDRDISYTQGKRLYGLLDRKTQDPDDLQKIDVLLNAMNKTQLGSLFPDIEFSSEKATERLSSVRKSLTLVLFTASDCVVCVEADRQFGNLYKDYHRSHGFTIYSVAVESDKNTWIDYIHREGIKWPHTIAPKKFNDETLKSLGITNIPSNFLLDEEGKIIAVNISPKGVHHLLDPQAAALVPVPKKEKKNLKTTPTNKPNSKKKK